MFLPSLLYCLAATSTVAVGAVIPHTLSPPAPDAASALPPHEPPTHVQELTLDPPEACVPERGGKLYCYAPKLAPRSLVYRYECGPDGEAHKFIVDVCGYDERCSALTDNQENASCIPVLAGQNVPHRIESH